MADQIFNVNCGFFDSVNDDRLYTADDMNRPYRRIVANGVFATPLGTPSTDLQVLSAGNGLNVKVSPGEGIFAYKWFSNPATIAIAVPANTSSLPRIDSVVAQVDTRSSERVGNIIYRTGTPASTPEAPPINTVRGVEEYRLANISVLSGSTVINNSEIRDQRGSAECPWVTSLIKQVDTSALFEQWQSAYEQYYTSSTAAFNLYTAEQRAEWEDFVSTLTSDLTVTTNMAMFSASYTTVSSELAIPVNVASYDSSSDVLLAFQDGLKITEGANYTVDTQSHPPSIILNRRVPAGTTFSFTVLKSVAVTEVETVLAALQHIDSEISAIAADSGWINLPLQNGAQPVTGETPAVRMVGGKVYIRGAFYGANALGTTICRLPQGYRPSAPHTYSTLAIPDMTPATLTPVVMQIGTDGAVKIYARSSAYPINSFVSIATNFITG